METQTENNINEAIDWLQETGATMQNLAVEQGPLYCREVVAWEFWSSAIYGGCGLVLLVIGVIAAFKFFQFLERDCVNPAPQTMLFLILSVIGLLGGPVMTLSNIPQTVKAAVSPRLVIIEHLNGLRK